MSLSAGSAFVTVKPLFSKTTWASAGKVAATGFGIAAVAATAFVKVGATYVGALNKIQALTDANQAQMERAAKTLESNASLYAKMGMTVGDAAGGVVELTKAGLTLDQALQAVNDTMVLAKAGELSVADASSLVANTLNTFHLKASRAGDIANYLANAANISSADVTDLAESLKYVAPVAASTGVSLEQTNAILAELSNSGIAASNAGTGFRKFLLSLQAPSGRAAKDLKGLGVEIFDASGKMKPLGEVIDILSGKLGKLTDEKRQRIMKDVFGLQGISSAQVILEHGSKGLDTYTKGVRKAGAAQKLAQAASKGFAGTMAALRAEIVSDAQAAYRKLSPALDDVAKKVLVFVQQMKSGKGAGGDFVDMLKDTAAVGKAVLGFFNDLPGPVKKYGAQLLIAAVVLNKVNNGLVAGRNRFLAWTDTLGPAESQLAKNNTQLRDANGRFVAVGNQMTRTQKAAYTLGVGLRNLAGAGGMLAIVDGAKRSNKAIGAMELTLGAAATGFATGGPVGAGIGAGIGLFIGLKRAISGTNDAKMPTPKQLGLTDIINSLDEANGKATEFSRNSLFDFLKGKTKGAPPLGLSLGTSIRGTAQKYGIPDKQLVDAMTGNVKQFEAIKARLAAAVRKNPDNGITANDQRMLLGNIRQSVKGYREQALEIRKNISANGDYKKLLAGFPKQLITKIETKGLPVTEAGVVRLARKMNLTPKQIKTIIGSVGIPTTLEKVQKLIAKANEYDRLHPKPKLDADTSAASVKIRNLIAGIAQIRDKTVHITATTNANVAEAVAGGGHKGRAVGGPVAANRMYMVGETGRELFVPNVDGRIVPHAQTMAALSRSAYRDPAPGELARLAAAASAVSAPSLSGVRVHMKINGRQIEGVLEEIADSRVDSAFALQGEAERAFG